MTSYFRHELEEKQAARQEARHALIDEHGAHPYDLHEQIDEEYLSDCSKKFEAWRKHFRQRQAQAEEALRRENNP